jgi:hypothetical protein
MNEFGSSDLIAYLQDCFCRIAECPLLAQSGQAVCVAQCPLSGGKADMA